jgi:cell division protein FtsI (penicillin-binding protein 3)/stage V sporulation protein D (sporulation-specific penicillin-binding protein)
MRAEYLIRIRVILGIVIIMALTLIFRLYMLQIVHGEEYRREANHQYVRTAQDLFDRGTVYFTERSGKQIAAASTKVGYLLAINPSKLTDVQSTYTKLNALVPMERSDFFLRAEKKDDPYEEVAHHIDGGIADKIKAHKLPGVQLFREQWRYYPGGSLAGHVLGFVGYGEVGDIQTGRTGIERYWESVLTRKDDSLYVNFFAEVFANAEKAVTTDDHARAGDVVTTIEPSVQNALEQTLRKAESEWHARKIGGIIINPQNGEIYALGALPNFDPNNYAAVKDQVVFRDPLVEDVYEMGSIIKPLAMAIGLDVGAVRRTTTYNDTGRLKVDNYTISNYDGRARGVISMQEVLNQSLNVGMAFVAKQVGGETLSARMRALGFGEETGVDLPFEAHGLIDNLNNPREVEYVTASFGQGIALTPIETARALCSLGNGGFLVTPHVVKSINYKIGDVGNVAPDEHERVFKQTTSEEITRMLVEVVDTSLRGGKVKKEHYSIAAKTGTAQIAIKGGRGYYDDRYLHSFFGYFPAYDPKFLVFLFHTEPQGAKYASETLTDPFMDLVDFLINYYELPPDR